MTLLLAAKQRAARSALLTRWLFGLRVPKLQPGNRYFDLATVALKRAARVRIAPGSRVLDMGTGTSAVLGLWLHRQLGCDVVSTDVDPETVERARENVRRNGAALRVRRASLFEGLDEDFDHVLFNPPYLSTETGRARNQPEALRSMWDGGPDGTDVIRAFLAAYAARDTGATVLLGINRMHVRRERVTELIEDHGAIDLVAIDSGPILPVDVYVLVKTKSPITSTSMPLA